MKRILAKVFAFGIFLGAQTLLAQTPAISSWSPYHGAPGTVVTVYGRNLSTVTAVLFNGVPGTSLSLVSSWTLKITVPAGTTTGPVTVINADGSYTAGS